MKYCNLKDSVKKMHESIFIQIWLLMGVFSLSYGILTNDAEVVFPKRHHNTRLNNDLETLSQNGVHEEFVTYEIQSKNANHVLDLKKIKKLPQESILLRTFESSKENILEHYPQNCYYEGIVRGQVDSHVFISTCSGGLLGTIEDDKAEYSITPQLGQNGHYFCKIRDLIKKTLLYENKKQDKRHAKTKRSILELVDVEPEYRQYLIGNETLYAELFVACDYGMLAKYNNSRSILIERVLNTIGQSDRIYQAINVRLVVVAIDIQENKYYFDRSNDVFEEVRNFSLYFKNTIKRNSHFQDMNLDAGIFFRHEPYNYGGGTGVSNFCGEDSVFVREWNYAVELGLSFLFGYLMGFNYEDSERDCKCLTSRGCVMRSFELGTRGTGFSSCNMERFKLNYEDGIYKCLENYPLNPIGKVCGNGIREHNEICDCGTSEMCERNGDGCCEPRNCVLKVNAECSYKDNSENCQPNCRFMKDNVIPRLIQEKLTSINESSYLTIEQKIQNVATFITDRSYLNSSRIVALVADILVQGRSITYIDGEKVNVLENLLGLVNIILDLEQSLIVKAQNEYNSSNKFLETLDIIGQIYSSNYIFLNFSSRNIGMSNSQANNTDVYIVAFEDLNKKMNVSIQKYRSFIEEQSDAVLFIPDGAIPQQSFIYAFVYRKPYFFFNRVGSGSFSDSLLIEASVSSVVVSVSVVNQTNTNLRKPISMQFKKPIYKDGVFNCYFWNSSKNAWSGDGCYKLKESNELVYCECNHLTNFALILDTSQIGYNPFELKVITWIGCGVSIVTLLLTVLILLRWNLRKDRTHLIHLFMCVSLLILLILFITGAEKKESSVIKSLIKCKVVAAGLHYFVLTTFCWMAVEGANLYQKITVISKLETRAFIVKSSLFAWGVTSVRLKKDYLF